MVHGSWNYSWVAHVSGKRKVGSSPEGIPIIETVNGKLYTGSFYNTTQMKKDLEPDVRMTVTRRAIKDGFVEGKFRIHDIAIDEMADIRPR